MPAMHTTHPPAKPLSLPWLSLPWTLCHALVFAVLLAQAPAAAAQRRAGTPDELILQQAQRVATAGRVELYQHDLSADPALAELADRALTRMEALLGMALDTQTLGPTVRIYVAAGTTVSHVWRGYEHPSDPKAVLFLNPMVARLALSGRNATYAHELAHLLTWRFASHTLREGLADWLALQLHPGAGVGPNAEPGAPLPPVPQAVLSHLGTVRAPPAELLTDTVLRRGYYHASQRFVTHLITSRGMPVFLQLYASRAPEAEYETLYGKTLETLVREALN